jgi:hypothetical protein
MIDGTGIARRSTAPPCRPTMSAENRTDRRIARSKNGGNSCERSAISPEASLWMATVLMAKNLPVPN